MQGLAPSDIFLFEDFRLDRRGGGLFRCNGPGTLEQVAIGSRALDILGVLIERAGEVVSKDEIIAAVWPGTVVEDSNLTVQISALRRVLDRGRANGSCIQTIAGRGYRFVAAVAAEPHPAGTGFSPAPSISQTSVAPRLSIVVLPFANLSDDREQQYFADAITEDVTTDLSRLAGMLVISRNTAFTYRNKSVRCRQIGRELGVHYVLEGSVRRLGNRVRVSAQLIDAEIDGHLWAERFDTSTEDLFVVQDEITSRIAVSLNLALVATEAARATSNPDALNFIFRGRAAAFKPSSHARYAESIALFERALELDPRSVAAQSYLALELALRVLTVNSDSREADIARAEDLAEQALAASPNSSLAHNAKARVLRAQRRHGEAILHYESALASDHNSVDAIFALGWCKLFTGEIEEAIPAAEKAIHLSPRDPGVGGCYHLIGRVHLLRSRIGEAILWLEKACNVEPANPNFRSYLAAAYALKGDMEHAAAGLAEARRLSAEDRFSSIARMKATVGRNYEVPSVRALFEGTYLAALRKAGMPEE
jgi:TolB-like protein/Tfp pilus assembly protein PilF